MPLTTTARGVEFDVRVVPNASRCEVRLDDDRVRVRVDAPPVEGAANERLVRFLAKDVFHVARSAVVVVRGESSRTKRVAIDLPEAEVRDALVKASAR